MKKLDFCDEMIIYDHSAIIAGNPRFESPIKVRGSKTYLSDRPRRWVGEKAKKIIFKGQIHFSGGKKPPFQNKAVVYIFLAILEFGL